MKPTNSTSGLGLQMLRDLGHPAAEGKPVYDVTFENVQAGKRTTHLFRLANFHGGLVVGTSDLSELALGWRTYGVGDHVSHYAVNASVPKTLVQHLVRWVADTGRLGPRPTAVLREILGTRISPSWSPATWTPSRRRAARPWSGRSSSRTSRSTSRCASATPRPNIAFLQYCAWHERYGIGEIRRWLGVFLHRFFGLSQFKRSTMPNAPKVGSGGSLSPRGAERQRCDGLARATDPGVAGSSCS